MAIPTGDASTEQRNAAEAAHDALTYTAWATRAPKPSIDAVKILAKELAQSRISDPGDNSYRAGIRWAIEVSARTAGASPDVAQAVRRHAVREAIAAHS